MRQFALTPALSTSAVWGRRDNTRQDSKGRDGLPQPQRGPAAPLRSSAAARRATRSSSHPWSPAPGASVPPLSRAPRAGPLGAPRARGSTQVSLGTQRKATKAKGAKRRRRKGRGLGTRLVVGWTLRELGSLRGSRVAFRLTPARGSLSLPFPGARTPFRAVPFSSPQALSAPARGSVLGIKRKEGGEKGGKGKGRRRKEDDPSKGGC